jgi:hypothetical protein
MSNPDVKALECGDASPLSFPSFILAASVSYYANANRKTAPLRVKEMKAMMHRRTPK